jgi:hypothetical protein
MGSIRRHDHMGNDKAVANRATAMVITAIIETIEEFGDRGAPLGPMYAALMGMISYNSFMSVIDALVKAEVIRVSHNCAYTVKR